MLRDCMLERTQDKEAAIRVQAVLGLAKLYGGDDDEDQPLEPVLLDLMRFDTAPCVLSGSCRIAGSDWVLCDACSEVRRAALYNLSLSPTTLPHVLERTRDTDAILRRTVFLGPLSKTSLPSARALSLSQREVAVKAGLGDREAGVRRATAAMLGDWLDEEDVDGDLVKVRVGASYESSCPRSLRLAVPEPLRCRQGPSRRGGTAVSPGHPASPSRLHHF